MTREPVNCPMHCGESMPPSFVVCRTCWREVPFDLKAEWWTATGHKDEIRSKLARSTIIGHLRQHGTAIPMP